MKNQNGLKNFFGDVRQHLMTGISYMIPIIVVYALFLVLSQIPGATQELMTSISTYAQMLIVPILTVYIAYSIAGRLAIVPTFIVGLMADQMGMGFLGGLIIGLLTGYLVKLVITLVNKIGRGHMIDLIASFLIVPILVTLTVGAFIFYLIAAPVSGLMESLSVWLTNLSGTNAILFAALLGAMIAFDMGGPVNKTVFTFALGAYTEGAYGVSTPVLVAISIPTLAMALAPFLAPKKYSDEEKTAGKSAIVLGLIGLTEGAIPFAVVDPFRVIPSIMFGSALGAALTAAFGVTNTVMIPALIGLTGVNKPIAYLLIHIVCVILTALLVNLLKKPI